MDGETLVALKLAHPFRPFTMVLADGRRLPIARSSAFAVSPSRRGVVYPKPTGGFELFTVDDIVSADVDVMTNSERGMAT